VDGILRSAQNDSQVNVGFLPLGRQASAPAYRQAGEGSLGFLAIISNYCIAWDSSLRSE